MQWVRNHSLKIYKVQFIYSLASFYSERISNLYFRFTQFSDYVIARALAGGIQKMVITGLKMNGCKSAVVMSKTRPNILYAAVGIHPHFVKDEWSDKSTDQLEEMLKNPCVVALGECGLDFNKDYSPRELQETAFKKQVTSLLSKKMRCFTLKQKLAIK